MKAIEAIGQYWETDPEGYLINPCRREKVDAALWPILDDCIGHLQSRYAEDLIAIYLRGSAARGIPRQYWADLDLVAILKWEPGQDFLRWEPASSDILPHDQHPPIDLALAHHDPEFPGRNGSVKMVLKTQSICIWGQDITQAFPSYSLGPDLAIHGRWLAADLEHWHNMRGAWPSKEAELAWLQHFWKSLLRSGMEVSMAKTGKFSTDLQPCLQAFSECHPKHAGTMEKVLECYLNSELSLQMAAQLMAEFVPIVIQLFQAAFPLTTKH